MEWFEEKVPRKILFDLKDQTIYKEISGIRQNNGKTLYKYWEHFDQLCVNYPYYQISNQLLLQYFYEELFPMDPSIIDIISGGVLIEKTHMEAKDLISKMAANS